MEYYNFQLTEQTSIDIPDDINYSLVICYSAYRDNKEKIVKYIKECYWYLARDARTREYTKEQLGSIPKPFPYEEYKRFEKEAQEKYGDITGEQVDALIDEDAQKGRNYLLSRIYTACSYNIDWEDDPFSHLYNWDYLLE